MSPRPQTSKSQFILALLGGLVVPALVIFLIVKFVLGIQAGQVADSDPAVADAKVVERIKPVAEVSMVEAGAATSEKSGEQVVAELCGACHSSGALGAPKVGDNAAWAPRISQGFDTLVKNAINGIRQMPPRGGGATLSDNEVAAAVAFMANQSGASFKAPAPAAPAADAAAPAK